LNEKGNGFAATLFLFLDAHLWFNHVDKLPQKQLTFTRVSIIPIKEINPQLSKVRRKPKQYQRKFFVAVTKLAMIPKVPPFPRWGGYQPRKEQILFVSDSAMNNLFGSVSSDCRIVGFFYFQLVGEFSKLYKVGLFFVVVRLYIPQISNCFVVWYHAPIVSPF